MEQGLEQTWGVEAMGSRLVLSLADFEVQMVLMEASRFVF